METNKNLRQGAIFGAGEINPYGQFFTGDTYLKLLADSPDGQVGIGTVDFEPGARNNWHIHHDGYQILLVTAGHGWYQEAGKPAQALKAGDVIVTREGVKHWHGAQADSWFEHIALTAGTPEWLEPVSDEWYQAL
ncbi:cupin domain-containing protein [Weissella diestrammenae]|uniref:Cupin domain-containing protein n=1 Tax=Weissella diestrammenae TaxID=1162633 RepID=A0A7G9T576_9LACO|nr:cupin domain-containing protein [Weissella diestrammenae]MCM0583107.1 cupin domain-containing protein [Weissella diestrammenae]QNN75251.1 cupin domain-containing protein [Weissella diestrammenae]